MCRCLGAIDSAQMTDYHNANSSPQTLAKPSQLGSAPKQRTSIIVILPNPSRPTSQDSLILLLDGLSTTIREWLSDTEVPNSLASEFSCIRTCGKIINYNIPGLCTTSRHLIVLSPSPVVVPPTVGNKKVLRRRKVSRDDNYYTISNLNALLTVAVQTLRSHRVSSYSQDL